MSGLAGIVVIPVVTRETRGLTRINGVAQYPASSRGQTLTHGLTIDGYDMNLSVVLQSERRLLAEAVLFLV